MRLPHLAPLPAVREQPEQQLATDLVASVMREVNRSLHSTDHRIVMRGGTAAKIGYGLTRPSQDIDIDIVGDVDIWTTLRQAAEDLNITAIAEPRRRHALKGTITILSEPFGPLTAAIDIRRIHDRQTAEDILERTAVETRSEILMYRAESLVTQKFALIELPDHRLRAKDRYDIAWWLTEHMEAVSPQQRIRLSETLRQRPELRDRWDHDHRRHDDLNTLNPDVVHQAITSTLARDPAVLHARWPDGHLRLDLTATSHTSLAWVHGDQQQNIQPIAELSGNHQLEQFMTAYGIWQPADVPARLREIALERQRAITIGRSPND